MVIRGENGRQDTVGVLLTAGRGERMRPLTDRRAKGSLPLCNLPLFGHGLHILDGWGCRKAIMNLHSHPDSLTSCLEESRPERLRVELTREPILLGSAGGIRNMRSFLSGGTFWILNGDTVLDLDFAGMWNRHRDSGAMATLALMPMEKGSPYAPVEIDSDGAIVRIAGKPEGGPGGIPHTFIGVQLVEPALIDRIPAGVPSGMTSDIYPPLIREGGRLMGFVTRRFWLEMGTPRAYACANLRLLLEGRVFPRQRYTIPSPGLFIMQETDLTGVERRGPALVGRGVRFADGVRLEEGVILGSGVEIGPGTRLRRTVLWEGSRVGKGASLEDCIVGGASVPDGASLNAAILLPGEGGDPLITDLGTP